MATINQVAKKKYRKRKSTYTGTPLLKDSPFKKGVCVVIKTTSPKKPNSAVRKIARVKVNKNRIITASIPGQGHNLQKFSVVLIRGGRANDVPGCRYKLVKGKYDFSIVENFVRKKSRSKWGLKKTYIEK